MKKLFALVIIFLFIPTITQCMQQNPPILDTKKENETIIATFFSQVEVCINRARSLIEKACATATDTTKIALVLDIDDTCILRRTSYGYLTNILQSIGQKCDKKNFISPVIGPTLKLFEWAYQKGVTIFFLTARPDKDPQCPEKDLTTMYKKQLAASGYGDIDGKKIFLTCFPIKLYFKAILECDDVYGAVVVSSWKKEQYVAIEKMGYCIAAVLDDQSDNLDKGNETHLCFPLLQNQKKIIEQAEGGDGENLRHKKITTQKTVSNDEQFEVNEDFSC
jgi:hypothetical protein